MIEVFKNEDSGHGDILSRDFIEWRRAGSTDDVDVETAKARLLKSINNSQS